MEKPFRSWTAPVMGAQKATADHSGASRRAVWEEFCGDEELQRAHNIRPEEMEALKRAALLGNLLRKEDFIFVLGAMRGAAR